ncbi:sensor histidine kinase [Luteipulveratus flavus]|uniref:histidine kinase n=1 Tax=Luteipulveratus flavus TaxID=3031728 RepID=A0ABT6CCQ1_9MICO|nr:histidine kinase [Luteipulveratus sp. YIM 133296]MDF8266162.1 histidine kinase [Luteipulveratus sp. YIM 133296]
MRQRWTRFLALDDTWRRPLPRAWLRQDVLSALAFLALAAVGLEAARSLGVLTPSRPLWEQYLVLAVTALVVVWRRRYPLTAVVLVAAAMFVTGVLMPELMAQFIPQLLYLLGFFSAVAWGAPRRRVLVVIAVTMLFMFGWIVWQLRWGDSPSDAVGAAPTGLMSPGVAGAVYVFLINAVYFGSALSVGQVAWRTARQRDVLERQARTIEEQSTELQRQATLDERMRIARELHDVVAHHVAVIGVQAGAARKTLTRRPEGTADALQHIEASAREAVGEMRALLGTLRTDGDDRTPQPGVADIRALVDQVRADGLRVSYDEVEARPGLLADVPQVVGLSLYRTAQEALTNIRRHSTAASASVVVRALEEADGRFAEVEVLDDGRPRGGTGGSGLGLVGMRERITAHGGLGDIGPRETGGYRVRVRFPLAVAR